MKYDKGLFLSSGEYVARKPFDFQGEHFAHGVLFDFARIGCSARKLRQLWDNGFIVPLGILPERAPIEPSPDADPGDEAEAALNAKRAEAGRKSAETRAAKKAAREE